MRVPSAGITYPARHPAASLRAWPVISEIQLITMLLPEAETLPGPGHSYETEEANGKSGR